MSLSLLLFDFHCIYPIHVQPIDHFLALQNNDRPMFTLRLFRTFVFTVSNMARKRRIQSLRGTVSFLCRRKRGKNNITSHLTVMQTFPSILATVQILMGPSVYNVQYRSGERSCVYVCTVEEYFNRVYTHFQENPTVDKNFTAYMIHNYEITSPRR